MVTRRQLAVSGDRSLSFSRAVADAVNAVCRLNGGIIDLAFDDALPPELDHHAAVLTTLRETERARRRVFVNVPAARVDMNDYVQRDAFFAVAPYSVDARAWREGRDGPVTVYDAADSSSSVVLALTDEQEREIRARLGQGAARLTPFGHWPTSSTTRWMCALGALVLPLILLVDAIGNGEDPWLGAMFAAGLSAILFLALWFFTFRPCVRLLDGVVTVQHPFWRRSFEISRVGTVEAGYFGLLIRDVDGALLALAWAVQKSNWATWTDERTRADEIAEVLMRAAREARGEQVESSDLRG